MCQSRFLLHLSIIILLWVYQIGSGLCGIVCGRFLVGDCRKISLVSRKESTFNVFMVSFNLIFWG